MCQLSAPPVTGASRENVAALSDAPLAIFLDVDGTLLDLAERPDEAVTPPGLVATLARTERKLGGALALISGRSIGDLDRLFEPLHLRASGIHGAEIRFDPDGPVTPTPAAMELPQSLCAALAREVAAFPGAFVENKRFSLVVHYRLAPAAELPLRKIVTRFIGSSPDCGRSPGCALRDRTQASRVRQRPRDCGLSVAAGVPRSNADLCRRRYDRRKRVRSRRSARRPRLFRRQAASRRDRPVRRAARGPRLAGRIRPSRERRMTERRQTKSQNLDLALIGNSCSAALVDRNARIVWWCFPYFDSDPVFSRLLADDEEKGFCEIALADLAETESRYVRNTAIVETILTDVHGAKVRICDFAPRFVRFEREYRPPQIIRRIEPLAGLPRIAIRVRPTHNYGAADEEHRRRLQSHSLYRRDARPASDVGRAAVVYRQRDRLPAHPSGEPDLRPGRPVPQRHRHDQSGISRPHPRALARLGAQSRRSVRMAIGGGARGDHPQNVQFHGDRRDRRRAHHFDSGSAVVDANLGLPLLLASRRLFRR